MKNHITERKPLNLPTEGPWTSDQLYESILSRCRLVSENVVDDEHEICIAIIEDCMDHYIRFQRLSGPMYRAYYSQDFCLKDTGYGICNIWDSYRIHI